MSRLLRLFVSPPDGDRARRRRPEATFGAPFAPARPAFAPPKAPQPPMGRGDRLGAGVPASGFAVPGTARDVVALATPADIEVAAGGAAAAVRRVGGAPVACVWGLAAGVDVELLPPPGLPAATRLARRLAAQGLAVTAAGAMARVALAPEPARALAEVRRAQAAAGGPVAIALARRDPVLDVLVREAGAVLVLPGPDAGMAALVAEQAQALNPAAAIVGRPASAVSRLAHRLALRSLGPSARSPADARVQPDAVG